MTVPTDRCIAVEDSPASLASAHRAGMRSIGVRSSHHDLSADLVVDTLAALPDDVFEGLLSG